MKVAVKYTANINMEVVKRYQEDLGEQDRNTRVFLMECLREWGMGGLDSATVSALGESIYMRGE